MPSDQPLPAPVRTPEALFEDILVGLALLRRGYQRSAAKSLMNGDVIPPVLSLAMDVAIERVRLLAVYHELADREDVMSRVQKRLEDRTDWLVDLITHP